jgi:hypothetical protein
MRLATPVALVGWLIVVRAFAGKPIVIVIVVAVGS